MKKIGQSVLTRYGDNLVQADVLDIKGDFYILNSLYSDMIVHKDDIIEPTFKDGGLFEMSESELMLAAKFVNGIKFYRYYPVGSEPFEMSYDSKNKYGFGIYFLDNKDVYFDKFKNARLSIIKPKVKAPLILTYHKRQTPSYEYSELFKNVIKSNSIKTADDMSREIIRSGFDSLVIYETRGIYLVILKDDKELFEVIWDGESDIGKNKSVELDVDVVNFIIDFMNNNIDDIGHQQGVFLYKNFFNDIDGVFFCVKNNSEDVFTLFNKGYLNKYEQSDNGYVLTEKGRNFLVNLSEFVD